MADPEKIGRYLIREKIGQGGMGAVYRAEDTVLRRSVALKAIHPYLVQDQTILGLFLREAKITARLQHPNIVAVYDVGEADGFLYIAMEYVERGPLRHVLREAQSPLAVDEAVRITIQVAGALEYAHSRGVIHRDVKPGNIMLNKQGDALLSDFGIAKVAQDITQTTTLSGTPAYMPPELLRGEPVDVRSDIYALGVVLYEMLALRTPFIGEDPVVVLMAIIRDEAPSLRQFNPSVTRELEQIVLKALAKNPSERYQTAAEFAAVLQSSTEAISIDDNWFAWEGILLNRLLTDGRIDPSQLTAIPESFRGYALERFLYENPDAALSHSEASGSIALVDAATITNITLQWDDIAKELGRTEQPRPAKRWLSFLSNDRGLPGRISQFFGDLALALGTSAEGTARPQSVDSPYISGLMLLTRIPFEGTKLPTRFPAVFLREPELQEVHLPELRNLVVEQVGPSHRVAMLFMFSDRAAVERARSLLQHKLKEVYAYDFIVISRDDLASVLLPRDRQRGLRQLVLRYVDLISVSPFVTTGPTPENMFFGRERELRAITDQARSTSFAIVAGRRFGKTSVLSRLHRTRLPAAGYRSLYHDCSTTATYETFLQSAPRSWQPEPPIKAPSSFQVLLQTPPADGPFVMLLDEADKLIPQDQQNGWPLFSKLRGLVNSGYAQIVLSGERVLRLALRDPTSPLYNFPNEMLLGPLDFRSVEELITRPMQQLEVELTNPESIVQQIWDFTSGHPNIVQRLCNRLIEQLNTSETRTISSEHVRQVIEDPGFQREDFLSTYWEAATVLEKIITLLMADDKQVRTLSSIRQALGTRLALKPHAREVDDALQRLVDLRAILVRTSTGYEFGVEAFPRVVAGTLTLDDMLEILAEEYQEQEQDG